MAKLNKNYLLLQGSYLFVEISNRVKKFSQENPKADIIRLGIGDVTEPLVPSVIEGLKDAVIEMSKKETFRGYAPEKGYDFLIEKINQVDFASRGIKIDNDEIFITSGAKEDTANFQELFSTDCIVAITDPVYPVYLDSNVMAGRAGGLKNGRYKKIVYLDCTIENNFKPELPKKKVDLIYLCSPNNPTGVVLTKDELKKWVDYARKNRSIILFDAAYEAFIQDKQLPHSIFEIEGAKEVAVEFRSLSKTAGFTGTRVAYTIVPKEVKVYDDRGKSYSLNQLWLRRQSTKFNGVAYILQRGAEKVFTERGQKEIKDVIGYYLGNAKIIKDALDSIDIYSVGGVNSPYIWLKVPEGYTSWSFFDKLLNEAYVVGTPGVGFGKCGEGYFRLTAFGDRERIKEAVERIKKLKF